MIAFSSIAKFNKAAAAIFITDEQLKAKAIDDLNWPSLSEEVAGLVEAKQFSAKKGEMFPLSCGKQLVLLVGLGKESNLDTTVLRMVARKALLSAYFKPASSIELIMLQHHQDDQSVIALIEGILIGTYAWEKYKTKKNTKEAKKNYTITAPSKPIYRRAIAVCESVNLTRDLVNDNADVVNAAFIEKKVKALCKGQKNVSLEILGAKEMKTKGLNLHLAVNQGSKNEPRLIIARYQGASKKGYDLAVVGKGITFDSGGINLKPSGHIETMRTDMAGTASTVGILKNCLTEKPKKNILFVFAIAENSIGSGSYRPGDVFKSYSGKTVEIGNTDAEGRLVLADALSYVSKNYKPAKIIDLATLTGACIVALGHDYTALLSNDQEMSGALLSAAQQTDDRVWQLPLYKELKGRMDSEVADLKNISNQKGAGTITAAYFLEQFIGETSWAHLDIAGTSFADKPRMYFGYGATGSGVRLVTEYIRNM